VPKQLIEFQQARPLTQDPAVLEYSALMVQALIPQLQALMGSIADFDRKIAEVFQKHPDRPVFESFPGAGAALAPRLSAAFGADRDRFQAATEMEQFSGIAPVTEKSGTKKWVHWRWALSEICAPKLSGICRAFAPLVWLGQSVLPTPNPAWQKSPRRG